MMNLRIYLILSIKYKNSKHKIITEKSARYYVC